MAMKRLPDARLLRQLLDYDEQTGFLIWRARPAEMFSGEKLGREHAAAIWNAKFAGRRAFGTPHCNGYRFGRLGRANYMAHRVIWKMMHGLEPDIIDHANGDKADNRLSNLRCVDRSGNARNMPRPRHNTSGYTGVHLCRQTWRWRAEIVIGGNHIRLGRFDEIADAVAARRAAERKYGFHKNHGR